MGRAHIGLGWFIVSPSRRVPYEALAHEGGRGGFRSCAAVVPVARVAVVLLSDHARAVGRLGLRLLAAGVKPPGVPARRMPA